MVQESSAGKTTSGNGDGMLAANDLTLKHTIAYNLCQVH